MPEWLVGFLWGALCGWVFCAWGIRVRLTRNEKERLIRHWTDGFARDAEAANFGEKARRRLREQRGPLD